MTLDMQYYILDFHVFNVLDPYLKMTIPCVQVGEPYLKKEVICLYREGVHLSVVIPELNRVLGRRKMTHLLLCLNKEAKIPKK